MKKRPGTVADKMGVFLREKKCFWWGSACSKKARRLQESKKGGLPERTIWEWIPGMVEKLHRKTVEPI